MDPSNPETWKMIGAGNEDYAVVAVTRFGRVGVRNLGFFAYKIRVESVGGVAPQDIHLPNEHWSYLPMLKGSRWVCEANDGNRETLLTEALTAIGARHWPLWTNPEQNGINGRVDFWVRGILHEVANYLTKAVLKPAPSPRSVQHFVGAIQLEAEALRAEAARYRASATELDDRAQRLTGIAADLAGTDRSNS